MTPPPGDLGRYRVQRLIGRGGMGEVYLARDDSLGRDVAIKLLPAARAEDHDARRRFVREAQAAAKLDHPCICAVFEVGETPDGRAFIAMPFVDGETLAARLERGPLPVREALTMALHLAEALGAAHTRGVVHRDLKPHNVMLTPTGLPKLLDFGIAKLRPAGAVAAEVSTSTGETTTGAVVGTPAYMAPEQVAGGDVDARSDLFALGAVLYEALTGTRAFAGRNALDVAAAIAHRSPAPVSARRPEVSPAIDELCARLLEKDPLDRFQTAEEVVGAIRLLNPPTSDSRRLTETTPRPRRVARWPWAAAAAVVIAGSGVWAYTVARRLPAPPLAAARWYERGTDFIREGAFHSAAAALDQAIAAFPRFPLAYARQAEALAELDEPARAGDRLLRMQAALGDEARLEVADRLRVRGIRALVLRDLDEAVAAFRALVERTPRDAGAWVDLGRAQEAAERRDDARQSYVRALELDQGLAPAHLRLASLDAQASRRDSALAAYAAAERLYRSASNGEGETEVLIRRGGFLDAVGAAASARTDLERALSLADGSRSLAQRIRASLALGSLTASEGRHEEAERLVAAAIADARAGELWTLVADGLTDLAGVLVNQPARLDEADRQVQEAVRMAEERGAHRTAARATLQRAALALQRGQPLLARDLAAAALPFLADKGYRRLELTALTIRSRAERDVGDLTAARATASRVLESAKALNDDAQIATALVSLAGVASAAGDLPGALAARDDAAQRHAAMGLLEELPFDLGARAELLIRLGRGAEAVPLLEALDDGIRSGDEAFKGRSTRLRYLRALAAVVDDDISTAAQHARAALTAAGSNADADALLALVTARLGRPRTPAAAGAVATPPSDRERVYWYALEARVRGRHAEALALARHGLALAEKVGNDELAWRLATIGAAAAHGLAHADESSLLASAAAAALERLSQAWGTAFSPYRSRRDLRLLGTVPAPS